MSVVETEHGPYWRAVERFPKVRQSTLSTFDSCGLSSKFESDYRQGWSTHPQARGSIFHRTAAECLKSMYLASEPQIPVGDALAHLQDALRQADVDRECPKCQEREILPGVKDGMRTCGACSHRFPTELMNLPMSEVKDLYWVTKKWAHDNAWDIANLIEVEQRLDATVRYPDGRGGTFERTVTGQMDALFAEGSSHMIVLDWKDTYGLPAPREVSFEGFFQQRIYGWLIMRNFPSVQRVTLREFYVRFSEPREVTLWRDDLDDVEQEFAALVERFDRAVHEDAFSPTPGKHCLNRSTRFLTDQGVRTLGDAAGERVRVLSRHGTWEDATIRSFGVQPLVKVTFDDGSVVSATPDHRWWQMRRQRGGGWIQTDERVTTMEVGRVPLVAHAEIPDIDPEGVRHGVVFGDGFLRPDRTHSKVDLWGAKMGLAEWFPGSKRVEHFPGQFQEHPFVGPVRHKKGVAAACRTVTMQPVEFKDMPTALTPTYARGFIAGLIATDGSVSKSGVVIYCEGAELAESISEVARLGGCVVSSVRIASTKPTGLSPVGTITRCLMAVRIKPATAPIIRADQRERLPKRRQMRGMYRTVVSIEPDGMEEVFCAVVPGAESFTLASGLATSNCNWCMRPGACPIRPEVRMEGRIRTEAEAEAITRQWVVAKAVVDQTRTQLQAWTDTHGPIPIRDAKGKRVLGYREGETTTKPTKEKLLQALHEHGDRLNVDDLYVKRKTTRWEQHAAPRVPVTDHDAVLLSQLEGSLAAAQADQKEG